ncbi:FO synthase, subunit 2-like, partial [Kipferlia bialata]
NICDKNCYYCGIRKDQDLADPEHRPSRFTIPKRQIMDAAEHIMDRHWPGMLLQGGETPDEARVDWLADVCKSIITRADEKEQERPEAERREEPIRIILSSGELEKEQYAQLREAGASRYLLRIETSDHALYNTMHPEDHSWSRRLRALGDLRETGYQVGTGVLLGVPGQTDAHIARDVMFLRDFDVDMVGSGPYIPAEGTPMGDPYNLNPPITQEELMKKTRRFLAAVRLSCPTANIAATTAMEALWPNGRELAIRSGANVCMPVVTPQVYRDEYALYEGKAEVKGKESALWDTIRRLYD